MSFPSPCAPPETAPEVGQLTMRSLVALMLPISLTCLMTSGSAPIVTGGISWMYGPDGERVHLAAFLVCFMTAIMLYSPIFITREFAIRTVVDKGSQAQYLRFFTTVSATCAAVIVTIATVTPLNVLLFEKLMNVNSMTRELVCEGMIWFAPISFFVMMRSLGQARHINEHRTWYVGAGTALRLVVMSSFVCIVAVYRPGTSGTALGGQAFCLGIGSEAVFVFLTARLRPLADGAAVMKTGQVCRYAMPMMAAAVTRMLVPMVLISLIASTRQSQESMAGYDLLRGTLWISLSMLGALQPAVVSCATSRGNLATLRRASVGMALGIVVLIALVAFTPLHRLIFVDLLALDNTVIQMLLFEALPWAALMPVFAAAEFMLSALHMRAGSTLWVWGGTLGGLLSLCVIGMCLDVSSMNGVLLVIFASLLQAIVSVVILAIGHIRNGLARALVTTPLSESLG
jgi:hypothetical protein